MKHAVALEETFCDRDEVAIGNIFVIRINVIKTSCLFLLFFVGQILALGDGLVGLNHRD